MKDFPLLPLFVRKAPGAAPEATINLTIKHGVRAALEYAASGDIAKARAADQSRRRAAPGIRRHGRARLCSGQCRP